MICPVCDNSSHVSWGEANGYGIEQCTGCGLGITSPFPDPGVLLEVNRETYPVEKRIHAYRARQEYFASRYRRQLRDIGSFKNGGRLLDVGCNIGMFLTEAARFGYAVTGVELNRECADYARTSFGLEIYSDYLGKIAFPSGSFDVVTMYDVLEHIPDMVSMLAEVKRILKPGGMLVVQSPNLDSLMADLTGSSWSWLSPPDHLYHFTPEALSTLLARSGFLIQAVKTWEPADTFCNDVLEARFGSSLAARVARKLIRVSRVAELLVYVLQPFWWKMNRGALVEAYVIKPEPTDGRP